MFDNQNCREMFMHMHSNANDKERKLWKWAINGHSNCWLGAGRNDNRLFDEFVWWSRCHQFTCWAPEKATEPSCWPPSAPRKLNVKPWNKSKIFPLIIISVLVSIGHFCISTQAFLFKFVLFLLLKIEFAFVFFRSTLTAFYRAFTLLRSWTKTFWSESDSDLLSYSGLCDL